MFNTFEEHLFICQSLLKERRRPPTGGLSEALEESLGGGVSTPLSPMVGSKTTPEASEVWFSPARGKRLVTALGGIAPIGAFPVGASFLIVVGTTKGLVLIGSKTLRVFSSAFFKEEVLSIFYQLGLEERSRPEGRVPQLLTSGFPQMGMKKPSRRVISASLRRRPVLAIV